MMSADVTPVEPVALPAGRGQPTLLALGGVAAVAGLATLIGAVIAPGQFAHSYLTAFVFVASLGLGALFWVMIHHLVGAGWSVVIRRFSENLTGLLPGLFLLFVPLLF